MMKRVLLAMAVLAVTAATSFAAGDMSGMSEMNGMSGSQGMSAMQEGTAAGGPGMKDGMPGCNKMMMQNPEQMLVMAYHKNVVTFGKALEKVARQRDTVPPDFARTVVAEMRRSVEQMEKYRAGAMAGMPAGMKGPEMQKKMDEHLVAVKTHLRDLEALAKSDTIPSREVLSHLEAIFHGCQGASCQPGHHRKGMPEGRCHKEMHEGNMPCHEECGHDCRHDGEEAGEGPEMMAQHHQMMLEMTRKVKAQDAEMQKLVERMKKAPKSKKVDQLAVIVEKMVKQRAEMTAQMEKMQKQGAEGMHHHHDGHAPCMQDGGDDSDSEEMNMEDMKMQDSDQ